MNLKIKAVYWKAMPVEQNIVKKLPKFQNEQTRAN